MVIWYPNQIRSLHWNERFLKPHLQGLWAEANTLVKWSFMPAWETYSMSLGQLSWAKVFENLNKVRRKYCRSGYYGIFLFKEMPLLFLKCQRGRFPQPAHCWFQISMLRRTAAERHEHVRQESCHDPVVGKEASPPIRRAWSGLCSHVLHGLRTTH